MYMEEKKIEIASYELSSLLFSVRKSSTSSREVIFFVAAET